MDENNGELGTHRKESQGSQGEIVNTQYNLRH